MLNPWRLRLLHQLQLRGTVRAVAEVSRMSPSSVSAQLAQLERETQTSLFERVGRRIALTPLGVVLATRAGEILEHIDAVEAEIAGLHAQPTGPVRVAAFTSAMRGIVVPAAQHLRREHPGITLEVIEIEPHQSLPAVQRGEIDLAVAADFGDGATPVDPSLLHVPLLEDTVVLVAAADRVDLGDSVRLASLASENWALETSGTYLADLAERLCRKAGYEPHIVGRFASYGALLRHVEAGLSLTMLPLMAVDDRYHVRPIRLEEPVRRTVHVVARRASAGRAAVRESIEALRASTAP